MKNIKFYLFLALACIFFQPTLSAQRGDCVGIWTGDVVGPVTVVSVVDNLAIDNSPCPGCHNWGPQCGFDYDGPLSAPGSVAGVAGFTITYTFSQPVNDLHFYWEGAGKVGVGDGPLEMKASTNGGGDVTIITDFGCFDDSTDGIFNLSADAPYLSIFNWTVGNGEFTLSNPGGDFTTFTIESILPSNAVPDGGAWYWALCDSSPGLLNASTCAAGDDAPVLNINN